MSQSFSNGHPLFSLRGIALGQLHCFSYLLSVYTHFSTSNGQFYKTLSQFFIKPLFSFESEFLNEGDIDISILLGQFSIAKGI